MFHVYYHLKSKENACINLRFKLKLSRKIYVTIKLGITFLKFLRKVMPNFFERS